MNDVKPMDPDDARNVLSLAQDDDPAEVDVKRMIHAGLSLHHEVRRLERELEYLQARTRTNRAAPYADAKVEGHALRESRSDGGPRHYLNEQPVHAGDGLFLLTTLGWMAGRYEWGFEPGTPGRFYFGIPGVYDAVSVPIGYGARLAWPQEITG